VGVTRGGQGFPERSSSTLSGSTGNPKGSSNTAPAAVADKMSEEFRGAVGRGQAGIPLPFGGCDLAISAKRRTMPTSFIGRTGIIPRQFLPLREITMA